MEPGDKTTSKKQPLTKVTALQRTIANAAVYYRDRAYPPAKQADGEPVSNRELSRLSKKRGIGFVSDGAIGNWINPEGKKKKVRQLLEDGSLGKKGASPTVDKLASFAKVIKCEVWQLLHPSPPVSDYLQKQYEELLKVGSLAAEPKPGLFSAPEQPKPKPKPKPKRRAKTIPHAAAE